ncbi:hypothetical protein BGX27_007718 [Mortierella sp. AM989]|nr:hypothetical protein BGX27_007718 [Mortierella sp. AM989]
MKGGHEYNVSSINDKLQPEILSLVFRQLEERPRTLGRCMLVCRSWYEVLGPRVWKAPRVLWSRHWSRFHPVSFMTTRTTTKTKVDGAINGLSIQQVSKDDLLTAMSLNLIHESDQQELTRWFEWKEDEKSKRINAIKRRRSLALKRGPGVTLIQDGQGRVSARTRQFEGHQLDETDNEDIDEESDEDGDEESDEGDDESSDEDSEKEVYDIEDTDEESESDIDYDASDDETPLMRLVSGIDYLQSLLSSSGRDSQQNQSFPSTGSFPSNLFSSIIARARRHQTARETRKRLARLGLFDGLPVSLPLQTCGRWIQTINLQRETPYLQSNNAQPNMQNPLSTPQLHPLDIEGVQVPFQHHQQQQQEQGLLASFIGALTQNNHNDDDSFENRALRRNQPPVRLRSRREFVTDRTLQTILENCPGLCRLIISECHGITNEGLRLIRDSKCVAERTLMSLHMAGCYQITDQGLLNLVGNCGDSQFQPHFESLDLAGCYQITDNGLIPLITQCGNRLTQLRVNDCINVTSESVMALAEHCPQLQWLDLGRSGKLAEAELVHLASRCSELEYLNLARHHPNNRQDSGIQLDEGFEEETQGEQEEQEEDPDSETIKHNNQDGKVEKEEEEERLITDYAIAMICESCPKLQLLDLSYISTITNNAIESLSESARSLVYLTIIGCSGITSQALYYLAKLRNTSGKLGCITMGDALGISEREIEQIMEGTLSGWQKSTVDETVLGNILGQDWN